MRIDERPFDKILSTIVWKVTEICNMACSYCFMYKSLDKSFKNKPQVISREVIENVTERIEEYVLEHSIENLDITLHGGEPLLLGKEKFRYLLDSLSSISGITVNLQTNATLIDEDFIDIFENYKVNIGVSLDGYPEIQNRTKMKNGKDSYSAIKNGLCKIIDKQRNQLFKGILCVVNLDASPLNVYKHFLELGASNIEFLLPLRNHNTPNNYHADRCDYFNWLKPIIDKYIGDDDDSISIRLFDSIIDLLIGSEEPMCTIRHSAVDMLTIDTDGSIQLIDDLRICGNNFVDLGYTTFDKKLVSFFDHPKVLNLYNHEKNLPAKCNECKYLKICGSGGHAFRYKGNSSFNAPSIYCADTYKMIEYIESNIYE